MDTCQITPNLSREELIKREKVIIDRICNDDNFAYHFFHDKCRPLFSKILWTIFGNNSDYDELVNELYLLLKKPNAEGEYWYALKTFDYRTTLFDWIKIVAVRHFYNSSKQSFEIPAHLLDTAILEAMIMEMGKAIYRKYMWFKYVELMEDAQIATKLKMERSALRPLSKKATNQFKSIVEHKFPEYYKILFPQKENKQNVDMEAATELPSISSNNSEKIDIETYMKAMPNDRYRYVIQALFIKDMEPEKLAKEMNTPISNLYNVKKRALDQLRDVVIYFNEISHLEKYINLISDDRKREILTSLFVERTNYNTVCSKMNITEVELKKLKKDAMKELKNKVFKAKS